MTQARNYGALSEDPIHYSVVIDKLDHVDVPDTIYLWMVIVHENGDWVVSSIHTKLSK